MSPEFAVRFSKNEAQERKGCKTIGFSRFNACLAQKEKKALKNEGARFVSRSLPDKKEVRGTTRVRSIGRKTVKVCTKAREHTRSQRSSRVLFVSKNGTSASW